MPGSAFVVLLLRRRQTHLQDDQVARLRGLSHQPKLTVEPRDQLLEPLGVLDLDKEGGTQCREILCTRRVLCLPNDDIEP